MKIQKKTKAMCVMLSPATHMAIKKHAKKQYGMTLSQMICVLIANELVTNKDQE